jgi:hypothetical protein
VLVAGDASTTAQAHRQQQVLMRVGAVCAVLGPLILLASFVPHGDLPTNESSFLGEEAALRFVAGHRSWLLIHTGTIVAVILWIGAFVALAGTLAPGSAAGALGRLLTASAVVGGAFSLFDFAIDGYALGMLAREWASASGPEQGALLRMAETGLWMLNGTLRAEIVVFYGLTFFLAGLAVALDGRYPPWFGRAGAAIGTVVAIDGLLSFAAIRLLQEDQLVFLVALPLESLWLLALGVLVWRRT